MVSILEGWTQSEKAGPKAAIKALADCPEEVRPYALKKIALAWADFDPAAAATLAESLAWEESERVSKLHLFRTIAENLADRDPEGALEWIQKLTDASAQGGAFEGITYCLARSDVRKAVTLVAEISDAHVREGILQSLAGTIMQRKAGDAIPWVEQEIPSGTVKTELIKAIFKRQ